MAGLDGTLTITHSEYRPCIVKGKKGLFHRWSDIANYLRPAKGRAYGQQVKHTMAIVEFDDGTLKEVSPYAIKFIDNYVDRYFRTSGTFIGEEDGDTNGL